MRGDMRRGPLKTGGSRLSGGIARIFRGKGNFQNHVFVKLGKPRASDFEKCGWPESRLWGMVWLTLMRPERAGNASKSRQREIPEQFELILVVPTPSSAFACGQQS